MKRFGWLAGIAALLLAACGDPPAKAPEQAATAELTEADTLAAMLAAFPEADKTTGVVAHAPSETSVMPEATRAVFLKRSGGRYFLLAAREQENGCHPCQASLSAFYLSRANGAFRIDCAFRDFGKSGGWGDIGEITPVTFGGGRLGFTDDSGFTNMGCTASTMTVYLFDDAGPATALSSAPMATEYEDGGVDIAGAVVTPPPAGADFAIRYTGSTGDPGAPPIDATVTYTLSGNALTASSDEAPEVVAKGC